MSEEERELYEYREKALIDYIDAIDYAKRKGEREGREKGEQEGRRKGRKEGKIETAKKLLQMGVAIEIIIEATGLSEEQIQNL